MEIYIKCLKWPILGSILRFINYLMDNIRKVRYPYYSMKYTLYLIIAFLCVLVLTHVIIMNENLDTSSNRPPIDPMEVITGAIR